MNDVMRAENEERLPPVHPGEVLLEDFMQPLRLSQYRLAIDYAQDSIYSVGAARSHALLVNRSYSARNQVFLW